MHFERTLFDKLDKRSFLLKKLWPCESVIPFSYLEKYLFEKTIPSDVIYIEYCDMLPLILKDNLQNRSITFFEPRTRHYSWLKSMLANKIDMQEKFFKAWRDFLAMLRERELEGVPFLESIVAERQEVAGLPESLHYFFTDNRSKNFLWNHFSKISLIEQNFFLFFLHSWQNINKKRSIKDYLKTEEFFKDIEFLGTEMRSLPKREILNEGIEEKQRKKANLIFLLPNTRESLKDFDLRIKFQENIALVFKSYDFYLTRKGKLFLFLPNKLFYPEIVYQEAERNGWLVDNFEEIKCLEGNFLVYIFKRQTNNPISGSLRRLQKINQLDVEEEIIKEIKNYLSKENVSSLQDIRKHLMTNCQYGYPQQPLGEILKEYFPYNKDLYFNGKPLPQQNIKGSQKKKDIIGELCCRYLLKKENFASYSELFKHINSLSFNSLYNMPYYYSIKRICQENSFKTPGELFATQLENPLSLRKLLITSKAFFEAVPNLLLGTYAWSMEVSNNNYLGLLKLKYQDKSLKANNILLRNYRKYLERLNFFEDEINHLCNNILEGNFQILIENVQKKIPI